MEKKKKNQVGRKFADIFQKDALKYKLFWRYLSNVLYFQTFKLLEVAVTQVNQPILVSFTDETFVQHI